MNSPETQTHAIGFLRSPFKEKFGLPRQPGLIQTATAKVEFVSPYNDPNAFVGLEHFSHIWLTFLFHQNKQEKWRPMIRPPRLGGNKKIGVFASRSSFRPNGIGMSAVRLIKIHINKHVASLEVACPDLLDGTPVLDVRPYIAYSDSIEEAQCSFAEQAPEAKLNVEFSQNSKTILAELDKQTYGDLQALIEETLGYDPRPAYKSSDDTREYGIRLYDLNIKWRINKLIAEVLTIQRVSESTSNPFHDSI